jgi:uncharacterized membrane protein
MQTWFIYACVAAVFAGLHAFTHKIAAERGYGSGYFNAISTGSAAVIGLLYVTTTIGWSGSLVWYGLLLCFLSAVTYVLNANAKIDSLKYIESALFFPLSKSSTVLLTGLFGILLFHESLTLMQMIGFVCSMLVPFLLLQNHISNAQKNLRLGLLLLGVSVFFSSFATLINKFGSTAFSSVFLYVVITHVLIAAVAFTTGFQQKKKDDSHASFFSLFKKSDYVLLCIAAGFFQFIGFYANVASLQTGALSLAYAIMSLQVMVPVFLSVFFFEEKLDRNKMLALILSVIATFLMK